MEDLMFRFSEMLESISLFMDRGGPVLDIIAVVLFVMWSLIIERFWFLRSVHRKNVAAARNEWNARTDKRSWQAHAIRQELISRVTLELNSTIPVIEVLVVICPLFGRLGTVSGMIEVFYIMAVSGGADAKQMSGGVARSTIPTMAGMVGALSGIFASNWLKGKTNREMEMFEDNMIAEHGR